MRRCRTVGWLALFVLGFVASATADEFERIEGKLLTAIPPDARTQPRSSLSLADLDALPNVLRETRSALLIAMTDQGNYVRMLVSPAFRKPLGGDAMAKEMKKDQAKPTPVIVLERFDTFENGNIANRLAHGKDMLLFDGFRVDLDSGQIVPEGQGGDLQFVTKGEGGPRLVALGKATLYTLDWSPVTAEKGASRPSLGRTVLPSDFQGRYRLFANGQWSGTLELSVADRAVSGRFRSDLNGASYAVAGEVAADVPQKISFRVKFPRVHQDYEGLLWTEGKGAMAGTLLMQDRAFGFFAVREGGRIAPEGEDAGPVGKGAEKPHRKTVGVRKGQYTLDGQPKTDQELTDALKRAVAAEPETWVLLQVPAEEAFATVNQAFAVLGAAGITTIRLAPAD